MSALLLESAAGRVSACNADGTFEVVILTAMEGSTGIYGPELMNASTASVFEGVGSHAGHPTDPQKPEARSPLGIIGRITDVTVGTDKGKAALLGKFKPGSPEVAAYVGEFADLLALSIYARAVGETDRSGKFVPVSFAADWPYTSVDLVLAAGAGGRFQLARESLLAIESAVSGAGVVVDETKSVDGLLRFASRLAEANRSAASPKPHGFAIHSWRRDAVLANPKLLAETRKTTRTPGAHSFAVTGL